MLWPLQNIDPADPLQGGYDWLSWTDNGQTRHPGLDFNAGYGANADRGYDVYAAAPGVIAYSGFDAGYGYHAWVLHTNGDYSHYCHLDGPCLVGLGQPVVRGQHIGECGGSGGQYPCHLHFEATPRKPATWDQWPLRWPLASVVAAYYEPWRWLRELAPAIAAPRPTEEDVTEQERQELQAQIDSQGGIIAELGGQVESLKWLLGLAQSERDGLAAEVERLRAQDAADLTPEDADKLAKYERIRELVTAP